jgi:CheY-like chemotaxis protein
VLLDMKMPLMNGFEFLQAYAQRPLTQSPAVVIVLTTSLNPRQQLQAPPIQGYLAKFLTRAKGTQVFL